MKLDIVDYFLCDGQGLFYFRPTGDNYQLLYFPKDSYRAYRDQAGDESVVLIYHFNVRRTNTRCISTQDGRGGKKKWIQLKVYKDRIERQSLMRRLSSRMRWVQTSLRCPVAPKP